MIPSLVRSTCLHVVFGAASVLAFAVFAAGHLPPDQLSGHPLEGGPAAASCGSCPPSDETSLLQVSPPLVVRPNRTQATSPTEPVLAWLQKQHSRYLLRSFLAATFQFSPTSIVFMAIVVVFFGLIALRFLYVHRTAPARDPKSGPPSAQQTPRRSVHQSRINSRDACFSSFTSVGTRTFSTRECLFTTTPGEDRTRTFAIPGLKDSSLEQGEQTTYAVRDAEGHKVLRVDVMRPLKEENTSGWQPEELVALWNGDGSAELAMCALGSDPEDPNGKSWACHVYQGGTEIFGYLRMDTPRGGRQEQRYSLLKHNGSCVLTLKGDMISRQMEVASGNRTVARVKPGGFTFGGPGEYYRAICTQDADLGMVVTALLGAERSFCHESSRRPSLW